MKKLCPIGAEAKVGGMWMGTGVLVSQDLRLSVDDKLYFDKQRVVSIATPPGHIGLCSKDRLGNAHLPNFGCLSR